ncbi:MAG: peptidoglycan DD-metalloendopeptidase family protein [Clostridiales bacterium]|nr:peptidoglycan DD-metalloendopeptidase family protein [Clostridiales bacterium]
MVLVRCRRLSLIMSIASVIMLNIPLAGANNLDTRSQKKNVDSMIQSIGKQKKDDSRKLQNAIREKNNLRRRENVENSKYKRFITEKKYIEREEQLLDKAIKEAEERYDEQMDVLKKRIRVLYKNSNKSYISVMAESKSLSDFLSRIELVNRISRNDRILIEKINNDKLDIEFKKKQKEIEKNNVVRRANETKRNMQQMQSSRAKKDDEIRNIQSRIRKLEREENELIKKSNELASRIQGLQKSYTRYSSGKMLWPLPSSRRITSPFGTRVHPIYKRVKAHHGIDIAGRRGSPIIAAKEGRVIISGWQRGYGNVVIIDHGGGITSVYAHCDTLLARVGQKVKQGEVIAKVGSTGYSTGPHLHFEVRKNGAVVNPLSYTS